MPRELLRDAVAQPDARLPAQQLLRAFDRAAVAERITGLRGLLGPDRTLRYLGRPERASPAEGWPEAHAAEQRRLIETALEEVVSHAG